MSYEVIPPLPSDHPDRRESGVFKKGSEASPGFLKFRTFDEAADYVVTKLASSDYPDVDTKFLEAIALWLQPHGTDEARTLLAQVRDRWVAPHAMTRDNHLHTQVLELSYILDDPGYAQKVLELRRFEHALEDGKRSSGSVEDGEDVITLTDDDLEDPADHSFGAAA